MHSGRFEHRCIEYFSCTMKTISIDITIECLAATASNWNENIQHRSSPKNSAQHIVVFTPKQKWLGGRKISQTKQEKRPQQTVKFV